MLVIIGHDAETQRDVAINGDGTIEADIRRGELYTNPDEATAALAAAQAVHPELNPVMRRDYDLWPEDWADEGA